MNGIDWATICSEIAVALYGTAIVGEQGGWPLCVHPLEECKLGRYGRDPTTLHTYRYAPVPKYHEDLDSLKELKGDLLSMRGWVVASKYVPRHRPAGAPYVGCNILGWVNKPPLAPNRSLRKESVKAKHRWGWTAECLAIHKALMEEQA